MAAGLILLVFTGTFTLAAVAVFIAAIVQDRVRRTAAAGAPPVEEEAEAQPELLREESLSTISLWHDLLRRLDIIDGLKQRMDEANLRWSVGRVTASMLLLGGIGCSLGMAATWLPPGSALAGLALGMWLPYWWILRRRDRRLRRLEAQFPDAIESLARMMRAGHPISSAFELLGTEIPAPLGTEFRRVAEERRLGSTLETALTNFTRRVPIDEVRLFSAAALLQARAGGRLTEVLERLAETVREAAALRGEVKAISAQGRMTGAVLTILPIGIALMLYFSSPGFLEVLLVHPRGKTLIWAAIGCLIAGHFVIQRIVKVKI